MATQAQPGRWRRFRIIFRRCRITVWSIILVATLSLLYLHTAGFPDFIKKPVLEKLHSRGVDLRFSRLRWRPFHGIVADNVFIGGTNSEPGPQLQIKEVQIGLNYIALFKREIQVQSLTLQQGSLNWPVGYSNEPPRNLSIEKIQTELQLLTNDVWELDNLQAQFGGAQIQLSGALTNASAIRDWKLFHGQKPIRPGDLESRLYHLAETLEQIHFASRPDLRLDIRGDARHVENVTVRLIIETPGADTPWGTLTNAFCLILLTPAPSNQLSRAEIKLRAGSSVTRWVSVTNLFMTGHLSAVKDDTNLVRAEFELTASSAQDASNHLEQIHCTANWVHSLTNVIPLSGESEVQASNAVTPWGGARQVRVNAMLQPSTNNPFPDASWAWWAKLAPYPIDVKAELTDVHSPKLDADEILCSSQWRGPELSIEKLSATLYGGKIDGKAKLNVATREVSFGVASDIDAQKVAPLLTLQAQNWLTNYSWNNPPQVKAAGALVLPAGVWTNRHPDWRGETRPSLQLDGQFHVADGAYRGIHALTADSHFTYSNMCWRLPDLVATRPEGNVNLFHENNDRTKEYYFRFASTVDPQAMRLLFPTNQQRGFDLFSITQPPVVEGEIWGRWHDRDGIHGHARVSATNFAVRGQSVDLLQTQVDYTNRTLTLVKPRAWRAGKQELSASSVSYTIGEMRILVTNGFSTAEPMAVARAIGPHIEQNLSPYRFLRPPTVSVEGAIPIRSERDADLHFSVDGGPFQWWKLGASHINGKIDWVGQQLSLKDMKGDFYLGKATGSADFNFNTSSRSADFKFTLVATDASLNLLAKDLTDGQSNKLEGLLTGRLEITNANTADWGKWGGAGRVNLRDGLIWDIPIFGVFSPALDTIMPGLGSSRAREGSATFIVTNGVIYSGDLKVETLMARLKYWGTINLKGVVDARMEAQLFRNAWVVGPVLSLALWPVSKTFEYQITGSIHKPKSDPVFIPKVLFFPLHPVETIKDMMPDQTNSIPNAVSTPVSSPHPAGKP
jgi:hypothetical protein